jgi:regulator of replication initiation timing
MEESKVLTTITRIEKKIDNLQRELEEMKQKQVGVE